MTIDAHRFLLAIRDQMEGDFVPELRRGRADVAERASFAALLLARVAADRFVFPEVAIRFLPQFLQLSCDAEEVFSSDVAISRRCAASRAAAQSHIDPLAAVDGMRRLMVDLLRAIEDKSTTQHDEHPELGSSDRIEALSTAIFTLDCKWRQGCTDAAAAADLQHVRRAAIAATTGSTAGVVTAQSCTEYLRRRFPNRAAPRVLTVSKLSGGRSKSTYLLNLENEGDWPREVVMRQDTGHDLLPTTVCDEYEPVRALTEHGVLLPRPLILEPQDSELGRPFFLMEKMRGAPSGDYYVGLFEPDAARRRSVGLDLARILGRLHSIDPSTVFPNAMPPKHFAENVSYYKQRWRQHAVEHSPMIEYAFHWFEKEFGARVGLPAVVHGDVAVHNILVQDGRVTALIDWELVHVGDPAEDIAYVRPIVQSAMQWSEFMETYRTAGGADIEESRLKAFAVWGFIRNAAVAAAGGDRFRRDPQADLELGFMGTATAYLEQQLIALLTDSTAPC